jgi:hypothetical protein
MEESKQIFKSRVGLNNNLVVPIIVVVLLTTLAVWLVPDDGEEQAAKKPLPKLDSVVRPLDKEDSSLPPLEKPTPAASSAVQEADPGDSSGGLISRPEAQERLDARTMIAELREESGNTGQKAFAAAEKQRSMGNTADAYLLYFFAAKQGHAEAAYILGTQSDPTYFTSVNSALDAPDLGQAIKWYQVAIDAGNKDARKNLKELAKRVKKQADAGSSEAQRLLLQLR